MEQPFPHLIGQHSSEHFCSYAFLQRKTVKYMIGLATQVVLGKKVLNEMIILNLAENGGVIGA